MNYNNFQEGKKNTHNLGQESFFSRYSSEISGGLAILGLTGVLSINNTNTVSSHHETHEMEYTKDSLHDIHPQIKGLSYLHGSLSKELEAALSGNDCEALRNVAQKIETHKDVFILSDSQSKQLEEKIKGCSRLTDSLDHTDYKNHISHLFFSDDEPNIHVALGLLAGNPSLVTLFTEIVVKPENLGVLHRGLQENPGVDISPVSIKVDGTDLNEDVLYAISKLKQDFSITVYSPGLQVSVANLSSKLDEIEEIHFSSSKPFGLEHVTISLTDSHIDEHKFLTIFECLGKCNTHIMLLNAKVLDIERNQVAVKYDFLNLIISSSPYLEDIDIRNTSIKKIPEAIATLRKLRTLSLYNNNIQDIPEFLFELPALRSLEMENNRINVSASLTRKFKKAYPDGFISL